MTDFTLALAAPLAPQTPGLRLLRVVRLRSQILLHLTTTHPRASCPYCGTPSTRVHSRYRRTVADLPWGTHTIVLLLHVRKFVCAASTCPYRTFAERLPAVVAPYARRTPPRTATLRALGLALGGQAAARLSQHLWMPTSRDTLLRLVRALPVPAFTPPAVIGIDEWAYRRGHRYGTLIVDLERQRPIAVLPDRQPATVAAWLRAQPQLRIVCRDRAGGFAQAAAQGAPQAIQVVDRWHLGKNLVAALEKFLLNKRTVLKEAHADPTEPTPVSITTLRSPAEIAAGQLRHQRLVDIYHRVHELVTEGVNVAQIANQLQISRRTVYRYAAMTTPPAPQQPGPPLTWLTGRYEAYVLQRWNAGCHNGLQIWRELRDQGHHCSARTVARVLQHLRQDAGLPRSFRAGLPLPPDQQARIIRRLRPYTAYRTARLFVTQPQERTNWQQGFLTRLCAADPEIATTQQHIDGFMAMLRERTGQHLEAWLTTVRETGVPALQAFSQSLQEDQAAVQAGLTLQWSNGQTEGQVHRLKLLKRQAYGRAGLPLLRQRVLNRS